MSTQFSVNIISSTAQVLTSQNKVLDAASAEMAIDILNRAIMNAPKASGALVRSGKLVKLPQGGYTIQFGDNSVRYAFRRHFENKKNPQTLLYLERAGESVAKGDPQKYFR